MRTSRRARSHKSPTTAQTFEFRKNEWQVPFCARRKITTSSSAADIGAYFVLSHGSDAIARPAAIQRAKPRLDDASTAGVMTNAIITASAAAISGYTVKVLNMNGADSAIAAHANVAAPGALSVATVHRQAIAAARAPSAIRNQHRASVAAQRVDRREDDGDADGMNRIDLAVGSARQVMRLEILGVVFAVVAARVVVFDLQIAVTPQALRDHQVVRLVAGRKERRAASASAPRARRRPSSRRRARW